MIQLRSRARAFYRERGHGRPVERAHEPVGRQYEVFVSHNHHDTEVATKVAECLEDHQRKTVYLDVLDYGFGGDDEELADHLQAADSLCRLCR